MTAGAGAPASGDPAAAAGEQLLDRLERRAALLVVVAVALALLLAGSLAALGLTLGGAASIFGFRSLRGLVGGLAPASSGRVRPETTLLLALRGAVLGGLAIAVYAFGSILILPLLIGVSAIPAALMYEAGLRLLRPAAGDEPNG